MLAVLPVHAIYAGFVLRESLVALMSILAVWTLTEVLHADPGRRAIWAWAVAAGCAAAWPCCRARPRWHCWRPRASSPSSRTADRRFGPLLLWGAIAAVVCLPWAWATLQEYGSPFYSYTSYFEYNFSWTVHHYEKGNTLPSQFYTLENLPEIVRVKIKSLLLIVDLLDHDRRAADRRGLLPAPRPSKGAGTRDRSAGRDDLRGVRAGDAQERRRRDAGRSARALLLAGLRAHAARRASPGLIEVAGCRRARRGSSFPGPSLTYCALVWADPTWAYDASWLVKRYQLHWPALREAGEWIQAHPDRVSPQARIMTWFPWELRVTSDRTTILMPRNYNPRRIKEVMGQYGVTHILWGSFEPPPYYEINPESWALELEKLRTALGLTDAREVYRTSRDIFFPVRLYRVPMSDRLTARFRSSKLERNALRCAGPAWY